MNQCRPPAPGSRARNLRLRVLPLALCLALACGDDGDGGGPTSFSFTWCSDSPPPHWVAQQDGDGAWQRVLPSSGNTYQFNFTAGHGGIASVTDVSLSVLSIALATTAELESYATWIGSMGCRSNTVSGTVAGVPETFRANVMLGTSAIVVPPGETAFQVTVANGPLTLMATRVSESVLSAPSSLVDRIIMRPGVNVANGGSIAPELDFEGAEAFAPATAQATISSLGASEVASLFSAFVGTGNDFGLVSYNEVTAEANQVEYGALPASRLATTDWQALALGVGAPSTRGARLYYRVLVSNRSFGLGPTLSTPDISAAATTPVLRPRVQLSRQAQYDRELRAHFQQGSSRSVSVSASAAYLGSPSAWDLTVPDLSAAAGWDNAWGLDPALPYEATVEGFGGVMLHYGDPIREGAMHQWADWSSNPEPLARAQPPAWRQACVHPSRRGPCLP